MCLLLYYVRYWIIIINIVLLFDLIFKQETASFSSSFHKWNQNKFSKLIMILNVLVIRLQEYVSLISSNHKARFMYGSLSILVPEAMGTRSCFNQCTIPICSKSLHVSKNFVYILYCIILLCQCNFVSC